MIYFFFLFLFGRSASSGIHSNADPDTSSQDLYLHLKNDSIEVLLTPNSDYALWSYSNVTDKTIFLSFSDIKINYTNLILISDPNPVKIVANLSNIETINNNININFDREHWKAGEAVSINVYIDPPIKFTFSNIVRDANITITSTSTNKTIYRILPQSYRSDLAICYKSFECSKQNGFSLNSDENYLSAVENIDEAINKTAYQLNDFKLKLMFTDEIDETIDFPFLNLENFAKIELISYSKSPQKLKLPEKLNTHLVNNFTIQNVQFLVDDSAKFSFSYVRVIDTLDVFPNNGQFSIGTSYENRKGNNDSPFKHVASISKSFFDISTVFESTQIITFSIKNDQILIEKNKEEGQSETELIETETMATIPFLNTSETVILSRIYDFNIKDQKILIRPDSSIDANNMIEAISIDLETRNPIHVDFSGFDELNGNHITFNFYSEISFDLTFSEIKNDVVRYHHYDRTKSELFHEHPLTLKKIGICMITNFCNSAFDKDTLTVPVQQEDLEQTLDYFAEKIKEFQHSGIESITIKFNYHCSFLNLGFGKNLNYSSLKEMIFISDDEFINLTAFDLIGSENITWKLINVQVNLFPNETYVINNLHATNGLVVGSGVQINKGNYLIYADLNSKSYDFLISEDHFNLFDYKFKSNDEIVFRLDQTTKYNPKYGFTFTPSTKNLCDVNFTILKYKLDSADIPISIKDEEFEKGTDFGSILINIDGGLKVSMDRIPRLFHLVVTHPNSQTVLQQVPLKNSPSKIFICYNSSNCKNIDDFPADKDSIYVTSETDSQASSLISSIKESTLNFESLCLIFLDGINGINLKYSEIPTDKIDQLQLFGYSNNQITLIHQEQQETYSSLLVRKVSLITDPSKKYTFNDLTVVDCDLVFQKTISSNYDHITIEKASYECKKGYNIDSLRDLRSRTKMTVYELFPDLQNEDYVFAMSLSMFIANGDINNDQIGDVISPLTSFYFLVKGSSSPAIHKFYICRFQNSLSKVDIVFENRTDPVVVEYMCKNSEISRHFTYNFTTPGFDDVLQTSQGNCINVETIVNNVSLVPTPTVSESPIVSFEFNPTATFSESSPFSPSLYFTASGLFSSASSFNSTFPFSASSLFTQSNSFQPSSPFTPSFPFQSSTSTENREVEEVETIMSNSTWFSMMNDGFYAEYIDKKNL